MSDGSSINLVNGDLKYTLEFANEEQSVKGHKLHSRSSPEKSAKKLKSFDSFSRSHYPSQNIETEEKDFKNVLENKAEGIYFIVFIIAFLKYY